EDRPHVRVRRLQANVVMFLVEPFDGCLTIEHGDHYVLLLGSRLRTNQCQISVQNPSFDHGITIDPQEEAVSSLDCHMINGKISLNIFNGRGELAGTDSTYNRQGG